MSKRSNTGLGIKSKTGLKTYTEEWNGHNALCIQSSLMDCFNSHFYWFL